MPQKDQKSLYLLLISIHGLIRNSNLELGRDADTGGQVKYVVELAKKLSSHPRVGRVDLITRLINDPKVDSDYARTEEQIADQAFIVRLPCGPQKYLRKEVLWNYLDSFSDQIIQYIRRNGRVPDAVHSHYADAGYVGGQIARLLGVPFIFTGHSLGRVKKARLQEKGIPFPQIEARYNISHRIEAEEFALDTAAMVVGSTEQEIQEQYQIYENYDPKRMHVIPPGVDLERFFPPRRGFSRPDIVAKLKRFLVAPNKPAIVALSRADERKNIETLIHAYGQNEFLRKHTNLIIFAGNRDDVFVMDRNTRKVISNILWLIDKYDLYGKVAYPKEHHPDDVPDIYRLITKTRGVFVNPALTEPFGLTLLEAAASGAPIVSTNDGGPNIIIQNCQNGHLVDPLDAKEIGRAIQSIIQDRGLWHFFSKNGIKNVKKFYSWLSHTKTYMKKIVKIQKSRHYKKTIQLKPKSRLPVIKKLIIADIDNTLIGNKEGVEQLLTLLDQSNGQTGLGVATGRHADSAWDILNKWGVPNPDLLITSVGSEIYYGKHLVEDRTWKKHLNYKWKPEKILAALSQLDGLKLQPEINQREYKISYDIDPVSAPGKRKIIRYLRENNLQVKVIHSHNAYLDILPIRASKGLAVRYLAMKWGINPEKILVAGDSGNDEEMLRGNTLGVVVGNYSSELKHLFGKPNIYFAEKPYAHGIIEGIEHYKFLNI